MNIERSTVMATDKQIAANRLNALLSTGPKTDEGRARSSVNSRTHGMTGEQSDESFLSDDYLNRLSDWEDEIKPETEEARYALERAVVASFRIALCEKAFDAMTLDHAASARNNWDGQRRLDATRLAEKLAKRPALIAVELEATYQGCDLKIGMWQALGASLDTLGAWSDDQTSLALDLLGVSTVLRTGSTALEPRPGTDATAHRRETALGEIKRLLARRDDELAPIDDLQRRNAAQSSSALLTPAAALIRRYERDAWTRYNASIRLAKARTKVEEVAEVEVVEEVTEDVETEEPTPLATYPPSAVVAITSEIETLPNRRQRLANRAQARRA